MPVSGCEVSCGARLSLTKQNLSFYFATSKIISMPSPLYCALSARVLYLLRLNSQHGITLLSA
jgi:hypothetical protein